MEENFKKGDVLCVNRGLYSHYGVYAGDGKVIHFTADTGEGQSETNPFNADVRKSDLEQFQKDGVVTVDNQENAAFSRDEIVRRAEALIGTQQGKYDLAINNCEHFAKWCKTGRKVSDQVENVKDVVPNGEEILETYTGIREGVNHICDAFNSQKVSKKQTFSRIEKKTKELLEDYDNSGESTEVWVDKVFKQTSVIPEVDTYVKNYLDDLDRELDINDSYRKTFDSATDYMVHFKKGVADSTIYTDSDLQKLPHGEQGELYLNLAQGDFYDDMGGNWESAPVRVWKTLSNLDTSDEVGKRNLKKVVATGLKVAANSVLHIDVPNTVTVPIASAGVEIGCAFKDCSEGKISTAQFVMKTSKEVAVAGYHIVKRAPEILKDVALSTVGKVSGKISRAIGGNAFKEAPQALKSSMKSSFAVKAKSCVEKAGKALAKVGNAVASGAKKVFGNLGKVFGR